MGIESKITSKGQTTIPLEIRERLGLQTGDRIAFIEMGQGFLIVPRNRQASTLFGSLSEFAIADTSLEDYDRAIGEGGERACPTRPAQGPGGPLIGLDMNILLRATLDDDPIQSPLARELLSSLGERRRGFVNIPVLMEFSGSCVRATGCRMSALQG